MKNNSGERTLKVAKTFQQDKGYYRRVRFDRQTCIDWGLSIGDVIEIEGDRITAAVVWRGHSNDEEGGIIRMDDLARKNAGVGLGYKVKLRKAKIKMAEKILVAPVASEHEEIRFNRGIDHLVKRGLIKTPLVKGDKIIIPGIELHGISPLFYVGYTRPRGIIVISDDTDIVVMEETMENPSQIGWKAAINILKEFIRKNLDLDEDVVEVLRKVLSFMKHRLEIGKKFTRMSNDALDLRKKIDMLLGMLDYLDEDEKNHV